MRKRTPKFVVALLFLLSSASLSAISLRIPQGMDFFVYFRDFPSVVTYLWQGGRAIDQRGAITVSNLPTQLAIFGKSTVDDVFVLLGLGYQLDWSEPLSFLRSLLKLLIRSPLIIHLPCGAARDFVVSFLGFLGFEEVEFYETGESHVEVVVDEYSGVLYETEGGLYLTFSLTGKEFLEVFLEGDGLATDLQISDDVFFQYAFFNNSPLGSLLYTFGDNLGFPIGEGGSLKFRDDGSVEVEVLIFRKLSAIEKRLLAKAHDPRDHYFVADSSVKLVFSGPASLIFSWILRESDLPELDTELFESVALSAHNISDFEGVALLSMKPRKSVVHALKLEEWLLSLDVEPEERDGFLLLRVGDATLVRGNEFLPERVMLYVDMPGLTTLLYRESPEVTRFSLRATSEVASELVKKLAVLLAFTQEADLDDGWDTEELFDDWEAPWSDDWNDTDEAEGTLDECCDESSELGDCADGGTNDKFFKTGPTTTSVSTFLNAYVEALHLGRAPDIPSLLKHSGLSPNHVEFSEHDLGGGRGVTKFVFQFSNDEELHIALEDLYHLLKLPPNVSVTSLEWNQKLVVIIVFGAD